MMNELLEKPKKLKWKALLYAFVLVLSVGKFYYGEETVKADVTVYVTRTGSKYHTHKCGNGNYYLDNLSDAQARGLTPCSKCFGGSAVAYSYNNNYDNDYNDYSYPASSSSYASVSEEETQKSEKKKEKPIQINKKSLLLLKGQTYKLKIRNVTKKVKWSSNKKSIVSVASNGKITAKKKGKAVITAKAGKQKKKCSVVVEAPKLNVKKAEMQLAQTKMLKLSGCKHSVKWKTSDSDIVTVKKGKIKAKEIGTAKITASVHGKKFTCKVKVNRPALKKITLGANKVQMEYNKETKIKINTAPSNAMDYYDISVKSSNPSVVSAEYWDGMLLLESYEKKGSAVISIKMGKMTAVCQVNVIPTKITGLELSKTNLILEQGESREIYYTVEPYDTQDYYDAVWKSKDEGVVKVTGQIYNRYAEIEAVGKGETDVVLTMGDKQVICHVVVLE